MPILGKEAVTGGVAEISAIMAAPHATFQSNVGGSLRQTIDRPQGSSDAAEEQNMLIEPALTPSSWRQLHAAPEAVAKISHCSFRSPRAVIP